MFFGQPTQPPLTGGINAATSPCRSRVVSLAYSSFTAISERAARDASCGAAAISAAGAYGAFVATLMGLPVAGDVLHVRTGRAGANIVILLSAATTVRAGFQNGT